MSRFRSSTSVTHTGGTLYTRASTRLVSSSLFGWARRVFCGLNSLSSSARRRELQSDLQSQESTSSASSPARAGHIRRQLTDASFALSQELLANSSSSISAPTVDSNNVATLLSVASVSLSLAPSNVLNTIATNCFDSHVPMMAAGVISCLVDYVQESGATTRTRNTSMISPRNDAPVQKTVNPAVRELIESFDSEEKLIAVVRGLPGSGKSNLCAPLPLLVLPLTARSAEVSVGTGRKNSAICAAAG